VKLLYALFGQLHEGRVFSRLITNRVIFQKMVFGISAVILFSRLYLSEWMMPGIRNSQLSVFFIMLRLIRVFFIFSILVHSWSNIKYAVQLKFYCKAVLPVSIIRHHSKIYTAGSAEGVYILITIQSTW